MVHLFISLYHEKNKARADELHTCLMNNLKSGCFDAVWIIAEDDGQGLKYLRDVSPYTVNVLPCTVRPTFRTFFEAANTIMSFPEFRGKTDDIITIVSNSDIYFESIPVLPRANQVFALCRYEVKKNGPITFLGRSDSQDVWIFRGPIKIPRFCDCHNLPGSDNRIAAELLNAGYQILNPSLTIKTYHLHEGAKSYDGSQRVGRPYHFIHPIELNQ